MASLVRSDAISGTLGGWQLVFEGARTAGTIAAEDSPLCQAIDKLVLRVTDDTVNFLARRSSVCGCIFSDHEFCGECLVGLRDLIQARIRHGS